MTLGEKIRARRLELRITLREFARRVGLWAGAAESGETVAGERGVAGHPRLPESPATDVEAFLELHLGLLLEYTWLPRGVLGATQFTAKGEARVQVSDDLSRRAE